MRIIEKNKLWTIINVEAKIFWCILSSLAKTDGIVYEYDEETSRIAFFAYDDDDVKTEVNDIIAYWENFKWA